MREAKVTISEKEKGYQVILIDLFRSVKLTIFLLILLAILSIIGTVITQNATSEEYIERYGTGLYEVLDFFALFDMYHSWWFSTILLALVVNLVACSLHRFPGVWNQFFRKSSAVSLVDSMVKTLPYVERVSLRNPTKTNLEQTIQTQLRKGFKHQKRIETESAITFFSEKARFSRLGVYIAHLSLIIILIGGLIGSIYGFKGVVNILEGETIDHIGLRMKDKVVEKPIPFSVRCDDFKVGFYDVPGNQRFVKDYTSILTVLENGKEVLKKTVQVNHPLHYKGLTFYQSSYGAIHDLTLGVQWKGQKEKALFKVSEGGTVLVPNSSFSIRVLKYAHQVDNFGEGGQLVLFKPNQQPKAFWLIRNLPQFDQQRGDDFVLTIEEVVEKEYTGLQVAKDPGVWVVWIGCALLILGLIISFFFSHQRVWVRISKTSGKEIVLAGSTSKNRVGFEKVFGQLADGIRSIK